MHVLGLRTGQVIDLADVRMWIGEQRGDHACNVFRRFQLSAHHFPVHQFLRLGVGRSNRSHSPAVSVVLQWEDSRAKSQAARSSRRWSQIVRSNFGESLSDNDDPALAPPFRGDMEFALLLGAF
jgi:hypothetical protein